MKIFNEKVKIRERYPVVMTERTFVMIKPDHVPRAEDILRILDRQGKREMQGLVESVTKELIETHYEEHKNKPFFPYVATYFVGRPVVPAVYSGENIIKKISTAIGETDPKAAAKGTIRYIFSNDSLEQAIKEKRHPRNVIHRADSVASAEREINLWLQYMKELK